MRNGTRRDAVLHSLKANHDHGLRRTNEDKRRAVLTMLNDEEWASWPQTRIAQTCGVSREYVSRLAAHSDPSCDRSQDKTRTIERNSTIYEQNTARIGRLPQASEPMPGPNPPPEPTDPKSSQRALR